MRRDPSGFPCVCTAAMYVCLAISTPSFGVQARLCPRICPFKRDPSVFKHVCELVFVDLHAIFRCSSTSCLQTPPRGPRVHAAVQTFYASKLHTLCHGCMRCKLYGELYIDSQETKIMLANFTPCATGACGANFMANFTSTPNLQRGNENHACKLHTVGHGYMRSICEIIRGCATGAN